jgi:hypothetical protein
MNRCLSLLLSVALVASTPAGSLAGDEWDEADLKIVRLAPRAFSWLPEHIISYLEKRRCLVPQAFEDTAPHNIIRGEFSVAGQTDLAVLCSVDRVSTILVFWKMSTDGVGEVALTGEKAQSPDSNELQVVHGGIGFSRRLTNANPSDINACRETFPEPGQPEPPAPDHDGIEDTFIEKGSVIWYFHNGAWMRRLCGGC